MIGLYAFFYGCLHFLTYLWLDKLFDFHEHRQRRREAAVYHGRDSRRSSSCCRWRSPPPRAGSAGSAVSAGNCCTGWFICSAIAAVVHYYWLVKSDVRLPLLYGAIIGVLLLYRLASSIRLKPSLAMVRRLLPS